MRTVLLAAILCAAPALAAAPAPGMPVGGLEQPEGTLLAELPRELRDYDAAAAARRRGEIDRALVHLRTPLGRANALLARATLRLAQARSERLAGVMKEIERDEVMHRAREKLQHVPEAPARASATSMRDRAAIARDRAELERARAAFDREIARLRLLAEQNRDAGIAELTELVCDPAGGGSGRGLGCPTPPALRAWPDLDAALYRLAYTLWVAKRSDDAVRVYRRILDETPRSRHRGSALVAIADHAFEQGDLAAAEPLYRAAQAEPLAAGPLRAYAAYKLGWVHLNQGRGREAFASLAAVPALAGAAATTAAATAATTAARGAAGDAQEIVSLVREARRDLARAFAAYGAPADAIDALEAAAPGHGLELAARAGERWLERARPAEASAVYRELVRRAPADPRRCAWQLGIVRGVQLAGDAEALILELEALAAAARDVRGQPAAARCDLETRTLLEEIGEQQLRAAQRSYRRARDEALAAARRAERLYTAYVRAFASDPLAGAALLRRAEAVRLQAHVTTGAQAAMLWRRAADRYEEALRSGQLGASERDSARYGLARARREAAAQ